MSKARDMIASSVQGGHGRCVPLTARNDKLILARTDRMLAEAEVELAKRRSTVTT